MPYIAPGMRVKYTSGDDDGVFSGIVRAIARVSKKTFVEVVDDEGQEHKFPIGSILESERNLSDGPNEMFKREREAAEKALDEGMPGEYYALL